MLMINLEGFEKEFLKYFKSLNLILSVQMNLFLIGEF